MAFSSILGEAQIAINANTKDLKRGLDKAKRETQSATRSMSEHINRFSSKARIALLAVSTAFIASMRSSVMFADSIDKMSVKTGLAIDTVQKLQYASTQLGFSFQLVETLAFRITRRMGEAAEGNERVSGAFQDLGVSIKDTNGNFKDVNTIFPETINALAKMEDKAKRNALAVKIFDTEFRSLLPLIEAGPDAINKFGAEAERLGIIISEETTQSFVTFGDLVSTALQKVKKEFMEGLTPALIRFNELLAQYSGTEVQKAQTETKRLELDIKDLEGQMERMSERRGTKTLFEIMTGEKFEDAEARLATMKARIAELDVSIKDATSPGAESAEGDGGSSAISGGGTLAGRRTMLIEELKSGTITLEEFKIKLQEINSISNVGPNKLVDALKNGEISVKDFERLYTERMDKIADESQTAADKMKNAFSSAFSQIGSMIGKDNPILGALIGPILGAAGNELGSKVGKFFDNQSIPQRALGGPINRPTLVGERGPELFIPGQAGTVVSNSNMGGGGTTVVQNINVTPDAPRVFKEQLMAHMPLIKRSAIAGVAEAQNRKGGRL
jgi:hypothetical protein